MMDLVKPSFASTEGAFATPSSREFPRLHTLTVGEIPVEHSVESGGLQLISVLPCPVQGQFKRRRRVQSSETSKDLKSLNEQSPKSPFLEGEESEISKSPQIPLVANRRDNLVARACTFSRRYTSTGLIGDQNWALYSSSGLTSALYRASAVFFKLLVPLAKYPLHISQDLLRYLLRTNTLLRGLKVRRDDKPYVPFFINAGYLRTKKRIVLTSAYSPHQAKSRIIV